MEEHQEQKHLCKFCKKTFPCGRSLGGHMRSHMTMNSVETDEKLTRKKVSSVNGERNSNNYMCSEAGGHVGYGLRENPKKTWRLSGSKDGALREGKACKECGKGFQSWKALFGHMRCHSERERICESLEDDSWTDENQKLVMDSQSDNEAAAPRRRRRSRRMRYKTISTSSSFSFANASSSVSDIEQEQEEVAMCLMMLSRDVGHWGGLNSVAEYSDNNSVVLEARSSGFHKQVTRKGGTDFTSYGDETMKMKKPRERRLESGASDPENAHVQKGRSECGASNSGVLRSGIKKVESEVSLVGFPMDDEFKKPKMDKIAGFELSDMELRKDSCNKNKLSPKKGKLKYSEAELGKRSTKETGRNRTNWEYKKYNSSKRTRTDAYIPELGGDFCKKKKYDALDSEACGDSQKKSRFECTTCNKIFHSYQALGGHRASHKKVKGCFASKVDSSDNSIETDASPEPTADSKLVRSCSNENIIDRDVAGSVEASSGPKKSKGHECPICFKVFSSGQALGGHKRSHLIGGSEARGNQTIVIQQQLPEIRDLLDLNLPAPIEEDSSGRVGFNPWWVGSNHKHEAMVGMISN
ncbi:PREDICTED: uncharacterized protein LOC104598750 [Nelumbo nucifera]|uniref:Uncharacterized protein LOC104598750 n=2 Tax=Nelumbo nucifera TaxID=4432 RepID=A0A1U7ZXJ7_NELNU|nr:PREDICTED: uncharacterized protein LOC104598750 [Nelumbo nucifera]DAD35001.1 TPA_asm: hypothetical protein HUJ06_005641 [Nelumbo nucifera]